MTELLTLEELAERTRESPARLAEWHARHLIGGGSGGFGPLDVERVWAIRSLMERGIASDDAARAVHEHNDVLERFAARGLASSGVTFTLADAAGQAGMDPEQVRRLWRAAGLSDLGPVATEHDVGALRDLRTALDAGFPEEALVQLLRVYGEALGRVAEAETRLFHVHVHKRLEQQGISGAELVERTEAAGDPLQDLVEPTVLYFHRKAWDRAVREDMVTHLAEEAGLWTTIDATGQLPAAVAFVDLCGFTSLTTAMGDLAAAEVIDRFASIVRDTVHRSPGQVVKQIGDGFMLLFPDAPPAIACGVALEHGVAHEPQFPSARVGIHWGPVLYRDGDYVGATVNLAARVTAEADPHQVVVTRAVHDQADASGDIELVEMGSRQLKGVPGPVDLFQVRSTSTPQPRKQVDPVCRMELALSEVAARVRIGATDHVFCSTDCLQRFVAAPDDYVSPA